MAGGRRWRRPESPAVPEMRKGRKPRVRPDPSRPPGTRPICGQAEWVRRPVLSKRESDLQCVGKSVWRAAVSSDGQGEKAEASELLGLGPPGCDLLDGLGPLAHWDL